MLLQEKLTHSYTIGRLHNYHLIETNMVYTAFEELRHFLKNCLFFCNRALSAEYCHPDLLVLQKENDTARVITLDNLKELKNFIYKTSMFSGNKACVILFPEQMNVHAANSCLKTLEDTPLNCFIFLITEKADAILSTIRSRCILTRIEYNTAETKSSAMELTYLEMLSTKTSMDKKRSLIQGFADGPRTQWTEFSRYVQSLIRKFIQEIIDPVGSLSISEQEVLNQLSPYSMNSLTSKYHDLSTIINNTDDYELDRVLSLILLLKSFEKA